MPSAAKETIVKDLIEDLKKSDHVLITHYQGLNAEEFNDLRKKLKDVGAKYKVIKNRLAKIALKKVGWDMDAHLSGPSALAYQGKDSTRISKVLFEFSKSNDKLKVKAGYVFGSVYGEKDMNAIASLPSKEVLLATLAARLQSPLQTLLATLSEPIRSLHGALAAVTKKKKPAPAS